MVLRDANWDQVDMRCWMVPLVVAHPAASWGFIGNNQKKERRGEREREVIKFLTYK